MQNQNAKPNQAKIYYQQNIDKWILHAQNKAIKKGFHSPPVDLLLRKFGCQFPPALFWSFTAITGVFGGYFAVAWGICMYFIIWKEAGMPLHFAVYSSLAAGLFFGFFKALLYYSYRRKYGLTTWEKFTKEFGVS